MLKHSASLLPNTRHWLICKTVLESLLARTTDTSPNVAREHEEGTEESDLDVLIVLREEKSSALPSLLRIA
jgi:hypothetical protein